jgi:maltose alpha-D-glucosyltransferase/alpha-amylase
MLKNLKTPILLLFLMMTMPSMAQENKGPQWLNNAIFYQIYPSSFMDSDGNGIGDLPGITSKLDYLQSLGVNAIWLNPVFESGWFDGGYDVIDYYKVDPRFGTNTDLVNLVKEAHKRGIKVCLDLVAGHTSVKCPWFQQSAQKDANGRYSDYYIWTDSISPQEQQLIAERHQSADPASDGRGHYVESNAPRAKYYLKNYYECQPALNYGYAHPDPKHAWEQSVDAPGPQAVRREMRNVMAFWFNKGIDGFRVDMAASLVKNDKDGTEIKKLWKEMREWKDKNYPECVFISEWGHPELAIPAGFNIDFMLHFNVPGYPSLFFDKGTLYGERHKFSHCYFNKSGEGQISEFIDNFTQNYDRIRTMGYIALPTANHDFARPNVGTRNTLEQLKVAMTFFLTMPGIPFIYYGDEIGMKYIESAPNKEGSKKRAGTRTPMQWTSGPTAGFSSCAPSQLYLPIDTENGRITVASEAKDHNSMLNYVRSLLRLRHTSEALNNDGGWELVSKVSQPYPMIYKRTDGKDVYIIALNPSENKVKATIASQGGKAVVASMSGKAKYKLSAQSDFVEMDKFSAAVFHIIR